MPPIDMPTSYTAGQLKLNKVLQELGFQTVLEYQVGEYSLDIYLPNLEVCFEFDGPFHWKSKDDKRDEIVLENYGIHTVRIKDVDIPDLKEKVKSMIVAIFEENNDE